MKNNSISRRKALKNIAGGATSLLAAPFLQGQDQLVVTDPSNTWKGTINHSVCYWCFNFIPFETFVQQIKQMGLQGIDLVSPKDWPILQKYGLTCTMAEGAEIGLTKGWNDPQYHSTLIDNYLEHIDLTAKAGYKNLICFSGNRNGMDDEQGLENCVKGLQKIMAAAEKKGITIQMELFNSKVDHPDYMCDRSAWGIELCKRLGSENFKLLYDIYHMQISEGDIIRTIRENHQYFGHYHTAGVPGRHEIDESQELYYPAIMQAIAETGYQGYVAQEFLPTDKTSLQALEKAVGICDV